MFIVKHFVDIYNFVCVCMELDESLWYIYDHRTNNRDIIEFYSYTL